ncbi:MAG: CBS domain-containing protein [Chloroflexota bacterium]|jgi:CBS domain-containing protein
MTLLSQLLQAKGHDIYSVRPQTSVYEALELMADKNIGAVLVLDEGRVAGIFSERDYARRVVLEGKTSRETVVSEVMTAEVVCARPDLSVEKCLALMTEKRFRHMPVLDESEQLVGLVSIGDVVKVMLNKQQIIINHLEDYIHQT